MLFTGAFRHTIDAKQRLAIPSEFRAEFRDEREPTAVYATPGPNGALWLWPASTFQEMADGMERSLLPAEELMEFDEATFPEARRLELDASGRVRFPEQMLEEAGVGETVMVVGVRDHMELRDPAQWEKLRQERHGRRRDIMLRARQAALASRQRHTDTDQAGGGGGEKERS